MYFKVWTKTPFHSCPGYRSVVLELKYSGGRKRPRCFLLGKSKRVWTRAVTQMTPLARRQGEPLPRPELPVRLYRFGCL